MSLREEIQNYIEEKLWITNDSLTYHTDEILKIFGKKIDEMIGVDNQTINMKNGSMEGKIAAQASKNTLTLVKEMLK